MLDSAHTELFETFRKCALTVLNCGDTVDNSAVFERYRNFAVHICQQERGIQLEPVNAPALAFVDGRMIQGIREHLFAVLRDIVYTNQQIVESGAFDLSQSSSITDAVFHILRNAQVLIPQQPPAMVVCWGGHTAGEVEYDCSKQVGEVHRYRRRTHDAYCFNRRLTIDHAFQQPFEPTHAAMAGLRLSSDLQANELAAELRRAFSGIVAANVKEQGIVQVERYGPFAIRGETRILKPLEL